MSQNQYPPHGASSAVNQHFRTLPQLGTSEGKSRSNVKGLWLTGSHEQTTVFTETWCRVSVPRVCSTSCGVTPRPPPWVPLSLLYPHLHSLINKQRGEGAETQPAVELLVAFALHDSGKPCLKPFECLFW